MLDEFLVQPSIITVIFEDLFQIIGFLLVIIGLWLWTNYNEHLTSELSRLATTDDLTGAYNRRQFEVTTRREINRASRYTESLSLIMFDIDYFKRINDSDGHDAGDEVLKSIAEIVQQNIRDTDLFARVGGEEFTVLAPGTTIEGATEIAEKLRQKIFAHIFEPSGAVTASFGVVELKRDESLDGMSKRVDNALYQAKERGRNRVEANV